MDKNKVMEDTANEWIDKALYRKKKIDKEAAVEALAIIYKHADAAPLTADQVTIVDSPWAAQILANEWAVKYGNRDPSAPMSYHSYSDGLLASAPWAAYYDCFRRLGETEKVEEFDAYVAFLDAGPSQSLLYDIGAILIESPITLEEDDEKDGVRRLHCMDGPALEWADGYRTYYLHGVPIQRGTLFCKDEDDAKSYIENPSLITREMILDESNAELRKSWMVLYGLENFLKESKAECIDEDKDFSGMPRRLFNLESGVNESPIWTLCEVECPSKRDKHYLWVEPGIKTCKAAVEWTFPIPDSMPSEYNPMVEA